MRIDTEGDCLDLDHAQQTVLDALKVAATSPHVGHKEEERRTVSP